MKKANKKDEGVSAGTVAAVGAGVLALAAGSYYFFGPEGKQNRGKLSGWMIKMKGEIVEKMENAKELSEEAYQTIVDSVASKYVKAGKIGEAEVAMFSDMLKRQWKGFTKSANKGTKRPAAKKAAPKKVAAKKSAAK